MSPDAQAAADSTVRSQVTGRLTWGAFHCTGACARVLTSYVVISM